MKEMDITQHCIQKCVYPARVPRDSHARHHYSDVYYIYPSCNVQQPVLLHILECPLLISIVIMLDPLNSQIMENN